MLWVMHPALFAAARETLIQFNQQDDLQEVLSKWTSVFNGLSVISNRETPIHRDNNSQPEWYDMLVTLGSYSNGIMELPGVGLRLRYNAGTVVGLGGKMLSHGVAASEGDRICYAYYMRDAVHYKADVPSPSWMRTDVYDGHW